jgi:rhodanese-related sulfurtransferase
MKSLNAKTLKDWIENKPDLLVWDVREPHETDVQPFSAVNIPLYEIPNRLSELYAYVSREIVLVCDNGKRSQTAALFLEQNGFKNLYNLEGGLDARIAE